MHFSTTGKLTPEVARLIRALHSRGFRVDGRLYDRAALEERIEKIVGTGQPFVVLRPDATPEAVPSRTLLERVGGFFGRLARGFTLLAFPFSPSEKLKGVRARALLAGNTLLGLRLLAQGNFFNGIPTAVLSAWIFGYMSNAQEIYRFKSQCVSLRVEDDGRISLVPNYAMLAANTFVEELALTTILRMSVGGTDAVTGDPVGVAGDAVFTAFAKTTTERPIAELYAQADRAEQEGDEESAKKLRDRAETLQDVFYNLLFPVLKFLQLPMPATDPFLQTASFVARTLSNGILFAIGAYGVVKEAFSAYASRPVADGSCATLLHFEGTKKDSADERQREALAVAVGG